MRHALLAILLLLSVLGVNAQDNLPAFEAASIKPNESGAVSPGGSRQGDRLTSINVPLRQLIQMVYAVGADRVIGGPNWVGTDRFDVLAKADTPFVGNQWQLMLRTLLRDRFKLAVHSETRDTPTWALVLARQDGRLGPNLRRATTDCAALREHAKQSGDRFPCGNAANAFMTGQLTVRGMEVTALAGLVSGDAARPVADKTGLTGSFDWDLTWTPRQFLNGPVNRERFPTIDPDGPTIFTALQEQLGLKLESDKGTIDVIVIDSVEQLTSD